jgi:hypothetical protein
MGNGEKIGGDRAIVGTGDIATGSNSLSVVDAALFASNHSQVLFFCRSTERGLYGYIADMGRDEKQISRRMAAYYRL